MSEKLSYYSQLITFKSKTPIIRNHLSQYQRYSRHKQKSIHSIDKKAKENKPKPFSACYRKIQDFTKQNLTKDCYNSVIGSKATLQSPKFLVNRKVYPKENRLSKSVHLKNYSALLKSWQCQQKHPATQDLDIFANEKIRTTLFWSKQSYKEQKIKQKSQQKKMADKYKRPAGKRSELLKKVKKKARLSYEYCFGQKQKSFIRLTYR